MTGGNFFEFSETLMEEIYIIMYTCADGAASDVYSEYELNPLRQPGLTLVFQGIHDGVYPWQSLIRPKEEGEEEGASAADSSSADEAAVDGTTAGAGATDAAAGEAGTAEAPVYTEAEDAEVEEMKTLPANAIAGSLDVIPEGESRHAGCGLQCRQRRIPVSR